MACEFEYLSRLLQHSGGYPEYPNEPSDLPRGRRNVQNVTLVNGWGQALSPPKFGYQSHDMNIGSATQELH